MEVYFYKPFSKNRRMPLNAERTRYSSVKGERIVRFSPTARLRESFFIKLLCV